MGVNSLPKTVTRQRRGCDLNPGPSAPESSTLTTRLPSHPRSHYQTNINSSWTPRDELPHAHSAVERAIDAINCMAKIVASVVSLV